MAGAFILSNTRTRIIYIENDMKIVIDLRQVKYFLAVAETLHFSRAAAKLGIAQPNLSLQIKKFEEALGCDLFARTTRGVVLTPAGAYLAKAAERLQAQLEEAISVTQQIGRGQQGALAIGFSGSAMYGRLPLALERFRRQRPKVVVQLRELYAPDQIPLLLNGSLDVGFIRDGTPTPGLRMTSLIREPFHALLPQSHPLATDLRPIRPGALRNERFVLFAPQIARLAFERTMQVCQADGFTPEISLEAPQWVTIVSLVAAGMGVSLAPASVNKLNIPGVVFRPLRSKGWSAVDAWTKLDPPNPAAKVLLKIAQEEFLAG
jgi:DNA-binding transcriptional LysR family regulator